MTTRNVYQRLNMAREAFHQSKLKKSGHNKFANYFYFELGDFIPQVTAIFNELGLCGTVSFTQNEAYLTVYNVDGEKDDFVTFTSPMVYANMEKMQAIQNLGSTHTYMRRYLWLMCMEIVENDVVDTAEPILPKKPTVKDPVDPPKAKVHTTLDGKPGDWQIKVADESNLPAVVAAVEIMLGLVTKEEDVKAIFQNNRNIFDSMKANYPQDYEDVLNKFKETKDKLKG